MIYSKQSKGQSIEERLNMLYESKTEIGISINSYISGPIISLS